jgi:hypothetical protein
MANIQRFQHDLPEEKTAEIRKKLRQRAEEKAQMEANKKRKAEEIEAGRKRYILVVSVSFAVANFHL